MTDVWLALAFAAFVALLGFGARALPFSWLVGALAGRVRFAALPAAFGTGDNTVDF